MGYTYGHLNSQINKNRGNLAYEDTMLMAFDMNGNVLDTKLYGLGASYDAGWNCRVSSSGSFLYLVGHTTSTFDGESYIGDGLSSNWDFYLKKIEIARSFNLYSSSEWTRHVSTAASDVVSDILTDSANNVYAIGFVNSALYGAAQLGGVDVYVIKYSSSGSRLITRLMGTTLDDYPLGAVIDPSETYLDLGAYTQEAGGRRLLLYRVLLSSLSASAVITGSDVSQTVSAFTEDSAGNSFFAGVNNNDVRLWRYDGTSQALTYRLDYGASGTEGVTAMVVDNAGYVYILGSSNSEWAGATNRGLLDMMLMKVDATAGSLIWVRSYGSVGDDIGYSLSYHVDAAKVYLCGSGGGSVSSQPYYGNIDFVVVKVDAQTGTQEWARSHGGSGEDS
eukprot:gene45443-55608_t